MEVITTHINADFDAMASMIAAKKLYPEALLVFSGSQEKTLRNFFVKSTMYLYDFKRLRDLDLDQVTRLILVDTRQWSRIGRFDEIARKPGVEIHVYDHHPDSEDDIRPSRLVYKPVGACVTLLTEIIRERGIEITAEDATILSLGLYEDTGSFTFSSTTAEDFEAAAFLKRKGADLNFVADMVTPEMTPEQVTLLNDMIHSARTYSIHGVDVCVATVSVDRYVGDFAVLVHKFKDIHNLDVVFALARMDDRVYLVARSRIPEVNAGAVASEFGGGGHATAASASIRDLTLIQVEDRLIELLRTTIKPFPSAAHLMTSPVISVDASTPIGEAAQIMVRYNINSMPVTEDGNIIGLTNRQFLEKAVFHGLEHQGLREFLNPDFGTVGPNANLLEIQTYLVEHQQRILPVVEEGKAIGVITRRDLLNFMVTDRSATPQPLEGRGSESPSHWPKRKSIAGVLGDQLHGDIIQILRDVGQLARDLQFKAYAVGGFVRDLLLRRANLDIDIVVEGDGIEFAKAFAAIRDVKVRSHKKFNTAVLIFPDGLRVDVATARYEYYQYPAALPVVEFGSLKMDLYRRDFTINTLAVDLSPENFGQLIDFFGGQRDIKEKAIRVLHNLSLVEDPTRILRAIRFEQRFGFRIGKQTASLIRSAVRMGLIEKLGGYRLFHEIQLILKEDDPLPAVRRMAELGVLSVLSDAVRLEARLEAVFGRLKESMLWYGLSFLEEPLERWWAYFLALFVGLPAEELSNVATRLDLNDALRGRLLWGTRQVDQVLWGFFQLPEYRPSDIYRALQPFRPEELLYMMAKTQRDEVRRAISHYFHRYRHVTTDLRGRDLKDMGIPPGSVYREILDDLLDARLNGEIKNRQEELARVHTRYGQVMVESGASVLPVPAA
ncbi:MAG: CBS domain-containing protein [Syntrophobacteraceae bacterium]|jgi:tRNA nucleotidyltransferase (CCA-adding enzyme)|nr:CBS domain-containing protein [Syntrophobacteraceae bacterium]